MKFSDHFLFPYFFNLHSILHLKFFAYILNAFFLYLYIYIYICVSTKKPVIEQTRDLIYLKFVATDFLPKIISPSAGKKSGDSV